MMVTQCYWHNNAKVHLNFIFIHNGGRFYIVSMFIDVMMLQVLCPDLVYHADAVTEGC